MVEKGKICGQKGKICGPTKGLKSLLKQRKMVLVGLKAQTHYFLLDNHLHMIILDRF